MYTCALKFLFKPLFGPVRVPKTAALSRFTPVADASKACTTAPSAAEFAEDQHV